MMAGHSEEMERLELYKIYVDTATKTTDTRLKINTFFVSINAVIIGSSGLINSSLLLIFGICINFLWIDLIKSCGLLNKAKFKVIHEIEEMLCHKCFHREQEVYKEDKRKGFTNIERKLPYLVVALYGIMLVYIHWNTIIYFLCSLCPDPTNIH